VITDINQEKCTGCGICVESCALDTLRLDTNREEVPPCQASCPAGVDIRGYMYLLKMGNFIDAISLIREALPLPAITGRVCFHPCETGCARKVVDAGINISSIEHFVADYWLKEKAEPVPRQHVGKVAIVGSGPAGLAAAYFLTRMGYRATVFEAMPEPGGMLRYGIPEYRLPRNVLNAQINYIRDMGVEFMTGITVGRDLTLDKLEEQGYKAIFVAVGANKELRLDIPGVELGGVQYGLEFLKNVSMGNKVATMKKVAVIGGGNVAIDAARTALRLGAEEVSIVYRRSKQEMPAYEEAVQIAEAEGVKFLYLTAPARILGKNVEVYGIECIKMKLGEPDVSNNRTPVPINGSGFIVDVDTVVVAVGEVMDTRFWNGFRGTRDVPFSVDQESLATGLPGVFASGDAVSGPASVIEAIAAGKRAAFSIDGYLTDKDLKTKQDKKVKRVGSLPKQGMERKERQTMPLLPVDQRVKNFTEVKAGFTEKAAMMEVARCMTCGSKAYIAYPEDCMTCYICELKCPNEAIEVHPFKEVVPRAIQYPMGGQGNG